MHKIEIKFDMASIGFPLSVALVDLDSGKKHDIRDVPADSGYVAFYPEVAIQNAGMMAFQPTTAWVKGTAVTVGTLLAPSPLVDRLYLVKSAGTTGDTAPAGEVGSDVTDGTATLTVISLMRPQFFVGHSSFEVEEYFQ